MVKLAHPTSNLQYCCSDRFHLLPQAKFIQSDLRLSNHDTNCKTKKGLSKWTALFENSM